TRHSSRTERNRTGRPRIGIASRPRSTTAERPDGKRRCAAVRIVMKNAPKLVALFAAFLSAACASPRDPSRVEPLLFLPDQREIALAVGPGDRPQAPSITATCNRGRAGRCDHVSVRYDAVLAASSATVAGRNQVIGLLLGVSDYNCSSFMARAFGRKASAHAVNTALASKPDKSSSLSGALDFLQLAANTTNGIYGHPSQTGAAESSTEIAIANERRRVRGEIACEAKKDVETYSLLQALSDLALYDETCSLQRGKELAAQTAAKAARDQELQAVRTLLQLQQQPAPTPAPVPPPAATAVMTPPQ